MQTDELRAELTDLANEVEPFDGDVTKVRRRVARRRAIGASIAAVVVVVMAGGAIVATRSDPHKLNVAGSVKEVQPTELPRADAAVVLPADATPDDVANVRAILGESAAVDRYSVFPLPTLVRALAQTGDTDARAVRDRVCAAAPSATQAFAVELPRSNPDALAQLSSDVGTRGDVRSIGMPNVDIEVFMPVKASATETAAVRAQIEQDPDVLKITYIDHEAAFKIFSKLFADDPELVQHETPAGLPESFRLELRDGANLDQASKRFQALSGVDEVIVPSEGLDMDPQPNIPNGQANLFMKVGASKSEIADLREQLAKDPHVRSYDFEEHDGLPTSFRITLRSQGDRFTFIETYQNWPGVDTLDISRDPFTDACSETAPAPQPNPDDPPATTATAP